MQIDWFVRGVLGNDDARYRFSAVCTFNMTRDETRIDNVISACGIGEKSLRLIFFFLTESSKNRLMRHDFSNLIIIIFFSCYILRTFFAQ